MMLNNGVKTPSDVQKGVSKEWNYINIDIPTLFRKTLIQSVRYSVSVDILSVRISILIIYEAPMIIKGAKYHGHPFYGFEDTL